MMGKGYKPAGKDDVTMSTVAWGGFSLPISCIDRKAPGVGQAGNWMEWSREVLEATLRWMESCNMIDRCT